MALRSTRRLLVRGLIGGLLAILGSGLAAVALAADQSVAIAGFAFSPGTVSVAVGDTVTWTNTDDVGHTATADDGSFSTGTIADGTSKSATFATAGTFAYQCTIHPQMTGTVVVAAGGSTPPPTDTLAPAQPTDDRGWALLVLAAVGGLALGHRRFARRADAPLAA